MEFYILFRIDLMCPRVKIYYYYYSFRTKSANLKRTKSVGISLTKKIKSNTVFFSLECLEYSIPIRLLLSKSDKMIRTICEKENCQKLIHVMSKHGIYDFIWQCTRKCIHLCFTLTKSTTRKLLYLYTILYIPIYYIGITFLSHLICISADSVNCVQRHKIKSKSCWLENGKVFSQTCVCVCACVCVVLLSYWYQIQHWANVRLNKI